MCCQKYINESGILYQPQRKRFFSVPPNLLSHFRPIDIQYKGNGTTSGNDMKIILPVFLAVVKKNGQYYKQLTEHTNKTQQKQMLLSD